MDKTPAPIFRRRKVHIPSSAIPSSSPSFATPVHPLKPFNVNAPKAGILPIILPPATLRPLAFRTFTKKHSLTLTSTALQELAAFIGRHCGSGWREEGLAERVLEEAARSWKNRNGGAIVDGKSKELHEILKTLEGNMSGGKLVAPGRGLPRGDSMLDINPADSFNTRLGLRPAGLTREDSNASFGMSGLGVQEGEHDDDETNDPRGWLQVIDAFEQPRLFYNVGKKHFERDTTKPSLLPKALHKTSAFRNRYHVIHQRLLRNESFQTSTVSSSRTHQPQKTSSSSQTLKITPIANMLGRHGSNHMLLGQLNILPTGELAISDLTGTIALDLKQAIAIPEDSAWFCPGMVVLVDGVYEEEDESVGKGLSGSAGVGGTLGGRFQGFFIGQPPCEKRKATLGITGPEDGADHTIGGGFGWIDFLGVGSERAVGQKMRRLERRLLSPPIAAAPSSFANDNDYDAPVVGPTRGRAVVIGEINLDQPRALQALRKILATYAAEPEGSAPVTFVLTGNFTQQAVMARGGSGGSIEYKEYFDALASALADFPTLLQASTFVFVPGDNDGWVSSFTAGASAPLPRKPVPDMFTSRIRRAFATANAEAGASSAAKGGGVQGSAVWASNPSRLSLFGPNHEIVLFRDDISARLRRTSVRLKKQNGGGAAGAAAAATEEKTTTENPNSDSQTPPEEDIYNADSMDIDNNDDATPRSNQQPAQEEEPTVITSATSLPQDVHSAQKLVKTLLDQGYLSPFRTSLRPVHWDFASALHLYPLPTAMVLVDATAPPFCVTYEGCHVMNPGTVLVPGRKGVGRWIEYEVGRLGKLRECTF